MTVCFHLVLSLFGEKRSDSVLVIVVCSSLRDLEAVKCRVQILFLLELWKDIVLRAYRHY